MLSQLKTQPKRLHRVVTLIEGDVPSVDYHTSGDDEFYTIHHPQAVTEWIGSLIKSTPTVSATTVIVVHQDFKSTIRHLQTIYKFASSRDAGEVNLPLSCKLYLIINQRLLEPDVLSPQSVGTQQFLRLMAMEHGASVVVVDDVERWVVARTDQLLATLSKVTEAKPILEIAGDSWEVDVTAKASDDTGIPAYISLYIPAAWDTINRVLLPAKSVIFSNDDQYLVTSETQCSQFATNYKALFKDEADTAALATVLTEIGYPPSTDKKTTAPPEIMTLEQIYKELGASNDITD
ncbi:hypothetical protein DIURU_000938 [Diutina rugosa]|uniref:Uncharacterized protein n=1 Tax=Diutina rugosa TaxID=5481 RepID=A0A642UWI6_DIURU|nr:uncharacterized protein DIURU_000938 [Diutina rugosa]KAA8906777.1 hypothetical protein DIURU_000938 [Diutina rugosa]